MNVLQPDEGSLPGIRGPQLGSIGPLTPFHFQWGGACVRFCSETHDTGRLFARSRRTTILYPADFAPSGTRKGRYEVGGSLLLLAVKHAHLRDPAFSIPSYPQHIGPEEFSNWINCPLDLTHGVGIVFRPIRCALTRQMGEVNSAFMLVSKSGRFHLFDQYHIDWCAEICFCTQHAGKKRKLHKAELLVCGCHIRSCEVEKVRARTTFVLRRWENDWAPTARFIPGSPLATGETDWKARDGLYRSVLQHLEPHLASCSYTVQILGPAVLTKTTPHSQEATLAHAPLNGHIAMFAPQDHSLPHALMRNTHHRRSKIPS